MAIYEVYHAQNDVHQTLIYTQVERPEGGIQRIHSQKGADVEAENLDEVFLLTKHIDYPWQENCQVTLITSTAPLRSTSVGDLIDMSQSGQLWMVANLGFIDVRWEDEPRQKDNGR